MAQASFGRKWLAGIIRNEEMSAEEKEQAIMEGHIGVTDGLKDRIEELQEKADKAEEVQKKLDEGGDWEKKYREEHKAFEEYRNSQTARENAAKIKEEYRKLLISEKISEEWAEKIVKLEDFSGMKLDSEGHLADLDAIKARVQKEYGGYVMTTTTKGAKVETPPQTGGKTMTREEIMAIKDTSARQKAIAENLNLFGKGV